MKCPVCSSEKITKHEINIPFICHLDFSKIFDSGTIYKCENCQTVRFSPQDSEKIKIADIYSSTNYIDNKKTTHVSFDERGGVLPTTYSQITNCLLNYLPKKAPKILDIGCFDLKLLIEINKNRPDGKYCGFDMSEGYKKYLPKESPNISFESSLAKINDKFDSITLINVLVYVDNLTELFQHFDRLLNADGFIYIETADFSKNPLTLLYGDLFNIYSPTSITNLFKHFGYGVEFVTNTWAPRSSSVIARKDRNAKTSDYTFDPSLDEAKKYLSKAQEVIKSLNGAKFKVLGTTVNAAVLTQLAADSIISYIDENPSKQNKLFYNKPIEHPDRLQANDIVLMPYAESSQKILERFKNKNYLGKFVAI